MVFEPFTFLSCGCFCSAIFSIIHILLVVWMYKDATRRNMDDAWIWLVLGFFVPVAGLIVYLLVRPSEPK